MLLGREWGKQPSGTDVVIEVLPKSLKSTDDLVNGSYIVSFADLFVPVWFCWGRGDRESSRIRLQMYIHPVGGSNRTLRVETCIWACARAFNGSRR